MAVVDLLEVVDVNDQQAQGLVIAHQSFDFVCHGFFEAVTVPAPGQLVEVGQPVELRQFAADHCVVLMQLLGGFQQPVIDIAKEDERTEMLADVDSDKNETDPERITQCLANAQAGQKCVMKPVMAEINAKTCQTPDAQQDCPATTENNARILIH